MVGWMDRQWVKWTETVGCMVGLLDGWFDKRLVDWIDG